MWHIGIGDAFEIATPEPGKGRNSIWQTALRDRDS